MHQPDPDVMLSRMSAKAFAEWKEYYRREPFPDTKEDIRFALLAAMLFNANRDPKKSTAANSETFRHYYWADEIPESRRVSAAVGGSGGHFTSWQAQKQLIVALNEAFGGQDLRPPERIDNEIEPVARVEYDGI